MIWIGAVILIVIFTSLSIIIAKEYIAQNKEDDDVEEKDLRDK